MARVLLVMGHRNTSRNGTLGEASRTPLVVDAAARELRRAGHVVHVYQQIDGDGDPNFTHGTLTQVASGCGRAIKERGIDVMIDAHFQGSNTPTSGCFCIFPDGNLLKPRPAVDDGKVANQRSVAFAARLAEEVSRQTGIPRLALPEPGFLGGMSETQTRVGGDGDRLAMFRETVPPPRCVRVVMEHGDTVADATIIDSPGFYDRVAQAYVKAVNAFWPIVPASLEYFAFAEPQRFTAQAGAIGRRHASTDSDIVRRYTAGESIHCSGYYEAQEVSGDNRWLRAMGEESPRVHRSGVIEEIPPGTQTAPPAGTVGGVEGMPERDMAPGEEALARLEAMARPETLAEAAPSLDSVGCDMTFFVDEPVTSVG